LRSDPKGLTKGLKGLEQVLPDGWHPMTSMDVV
jgi:hypothetical protein